MQNANGERQQSDGISGLELSRVIYAKYGVAPGLIAPVASLALGERTARFAMQRLPLLASIQERWFGSNILPSIWSAHQFTWLESLHRRRKAGPTRSQDSGSATAPFIARSQQVNSAPAPDSPVSEHRVDPASSSSESPGQADSMPVSTVATPVARSSISELTAAPPQPQSAPIAVQAVELSRPSSAIIARPVLTGEVHEKQQATPVSRDIDSEPAKTAVDKEGVSNSNSVLRAETTVRSTSQPHENGVSRSAGPEGHQGSSLAAEAAIARGNDASAQPANQSTLERTAQIVTQRPTSSGRKATHVAPVLQKSGAAFGNETPVHPQSRQVADRLPLMAAHDGSLGQISTTPMSIAAPDAVSGESLAAGPKVHRDTASPGAENIERPILARSAEAATRTSAREVHLQHPTEGSLPRSAQEAGLTSGAYRPISTPVMSGTRDQQTSTARVSLSPSFSATSALQKHDHSAAFGNKEVARGAVHRNSVAGYGKEAPVGRDVAGAQLKSVHNSGIPAVQVERVLNSASQDVRGASAAESGFIRHERPIVLRSQSNPTALDAGVDGAAHRFAALPADTNSVDEAVGVSERVRASREPARNARSSSDTSVPDGSVADSPDPPRRATLPRPTVARVHPTIAARIADQVERHAAPGEILPRSGNSRLHSSARATASAIADRFADFSITHLAFQSASRSYRSPGYAPAQALVTAVVHRAADLLPPSPAPEPVDATPARPILPDTNARLKQAMNIDLNQLVNRVYEMLVRRLASERQRRGM